MATDYAELLTQSVSEVFEAMSFLEVTALPAVTQPREVRGLGLTATVSLGGEISGVLALHCHEDFARECTRQMLNAERSPAPAEIGDTVGELVNMIAGSLKRRLSSTTSLFAISLPAVIVSRGHSIGYGGAKEDFPRVLIPFSVDNSVRFYVELTYHKM